MPVQDTVTRPRKEGDEIYWGRQLDARQALVAEGAGVRWYYLFALLGSPQIGLDQCGGTLRLQSRASRYHAKRASS